MSLFKENLDVITSKFKYSTIPITNMISDWEQYLNIKTEEIFGGEAIAVFVPSLVNILPYFKSMKSGQYINTDCRFFTLLIGCLKKDNVNEKSVFFMYTIIPPIEPSIPEGCYYITMDSDNFMEGNHQLSTVLSDSQGQWIVKIDGDKYIGIVSEGVMICDIKNWIDIYQNNVQNELKIQKEYQPIISSLRGILNCKIKIDGFIIGIYSFETNYPKNIFNELCN